MIEYSNISNLFFSLLIEGLPFLLLGILVSSCLLVFVDKHHLPVGLTSNNFWTPFWGILLGFLLPVCQYGNIPVSRRLLKQGLPLGLVISFLITAPTINPIVIILSSHAFNQQPQIIFYRLLFTALIAIIIGSIFTFYRKPIPQPSIVNILLSATEIPLPLAEIKPSPPPINKIVHYPYLDIEKDSLIDQLWFKQLIIFINNTVQEFIHFSLFWIFGCAIATFLQLILPSGSILNLGTNPVTKILAALLLSTSLSLSSLSSSFFLPPLATSLSMGSNLAFLVWGSLANLKTITLLLTTFSPKILLYFLILSLLLTILLSLSIDFYIP